MKLSIVDKIVGAIVAVLVVTALLPTLFSALASGNGTTAVNWSAITLGTQVYNFSWVPFVIGLLALVGVIYFLIKHFEI